METNREPVILIVDDTYKIIQILSFILKKENYEISFANNGMEALNKVEEVDPDLILLDVMMPELNGYKVCQKLKENPATKNIPVIFLTAKTETEDMVKGFKLGAVDYIKKPFNITELQVRVKTQIDLKLARDNERKHLEEIARKNKKLEELMKVKNEFLGMAVHDLRNPIAAIKMFSSLLLEKEESKTPEEIDFIKEIKNLSNYMLNLLAELLDMTAIESGKLKLDIKKQSYLEFIKNNIKINKALAEKKDIFLELKFFAQLPEISFDKNKMTQVMDNLISNAIKFSHRNTKIIIEIRKEKDYIVTSVIDEGQGIPEKEQKNIFKAFQKTSVKATNNEQSIGLGLAITQKIIKGHRGEIYLESKPGAGSKFYFTLPLD